MQGCQIVLDPRYQNGKNIPSDQESHKNMPNGHKEKNIFSKKYIPLQDLPKFAQSGIFWFENKTSGNPAPIIGCPRYLWISLQPFLPFRLLSRKRIFSLLC
jgi:hypothetical protein